ncbi:ribosomal protein S18-alanine N-acetyltransferase [Brooklawnia cerclae]|uniref:Ribosomal-protein-alanine N-acetyltransferase n=1 Tax=Brooklawnia cerclae TaxID=349934 RepID=A0ABX0SC24_9ACTN|nr:GNAT family N-acetyltransferase [Brooklawnia cerclae]NIH55884.1 ribosomal-protein-alanine N-acetyltransferase [Brooklawnia cerclae]
MLISAVTTADLPALVALEESGFDKGERWSMESWRAELDAPDRLVVMSHSMGRVEAAASFRVVGDTAELLRIVVAPECRRRGAAGRLLQLGLEWAEAAGADRMLLEVRDDNSPALALYRRAGFEPIARRQNYYPGHDAVVMELELRPCAAVGPGVWDVA